MTDQSTALIQFASFPLLSLLIFLPLAAGGALFLLRSDSSVRRFALCASLIELLLSLLSVVQFRGDFGGMQWVERGDWIASLNVEYFLGVDGISILFLPFTALLTTVVIVSSWTGVNRLVKLYYALLLALESFTVGIFSALDLILFFLFWELTLIPIYFLISLWGIGPQRRLAAVKYTLFMLVGGVPLLFGFVLLGLNHAGWVGTAAPGGLTFDYLTLLQVPIPPEVQGTIFLLLFLGFAVKAPLFPLHTWLPAVAMEGPVGVTAIMVGLKLGLYGLMRFALPLSPEAAREYFWLMASLGVVGILYGALVALAQTNLRRMLAFSSISHVGFVVVGLAAFNVAGVQGAVFQTLNFAVVASGIFLLAGSIHQRIGTTDLGSLGGGAATMPLLATCFFLLGLASIGVPGTNGFAAEHLILLGAFQAHPGLGLAGLLGVILGAAYFLGSFRKAFMGPVTARVIREAADLRPRERMVALALVILMLVGGLFPNGILDLTAPSVEAWMERFGSQTDFVAESTRAFGESEG